jgi:voltage-gated potassium channel
MFKVLVFSFGIMGVCLVIHIAGIVVMADRLIKLRPAIERRTGHLFDAMLLFTVFLIIVMLHVAEAGLWAIFYLSYGLFKDFETSLYFSLKSYSTVGYGDVLLPDTWRLLGTFEAISGALLVGLSTAFLFAIVNALFQFRQTTKRES